MHRSAILGPSSPSYVAALEKKFGRTFSWVCIGFFKSQPKKCNFDQNRINFTNMLVVLT